MTATQEIVLSEGQDQALTKLFEFLTNKDETFFVLGGSAGTGKSTLVKEMLNRLRDFLSSMLAIDENFPEYEVVLTATTNKAAEALAYATGKQVITIHSHLKLMVETDYSTGKTRLKSSKRVVHTNQLVIIDEASYVDDVLKFHIASSFKDSKIIYIGDPYQCTPVGLTDPPVFKSGYPEAILSQIMRQAEGNPIIELATAFRETVKTGEFFSFEPDGNAIQHVSQEDFEDLLKQDFGRKDWAFWDSKVLTWTNKTAVKYNHKIREMAHGEPQFQSGDYATVNHFISDKTYRKSYKTDQTVLITKIEDNAREHDVPGKYFTLDGLSRFFMPNSLLTWRKRLNQAQRDHDMCTAREIQENWIDLRAVFACTINKSQGSTFDRVFIDLNDLKRCYDGITLARLLYVAVSRARHQVFLTGDLV